MKAEGSDTEPGFRYLEMVLTVVQGPYQGRELTFTGDVVTAGKSPENDIPLPDETVSRRHLEIVREGRGFLLRDMGSTNGTFLDGSEIREAFLRNGAQVTLGQTRFRFRAVERRVAAPPWEEGDFDGLVGRSPEMRQAFGLVRAVAPTGLTVVIEGPEGSGRRSLARVLHQRSALRSAPLVVVNCAELPAARLEAALLAPEGGALGRRHGGTVLLLEPWELPAALQGPLAEAIRSRRSPSSSTGKAKEVPPGVRRLVAVTSRPLRDELARGRLDPELHAVLDRVVVKLPPLASRPGEAALVAESWLAQEGVRLLPFVHRQLEWLLSLGEAAGWPGNLRGLRAQVDALVGRLGGSGGQAHGAGGLVQGLGAPSGESGLPFDQSLSFGEQKGRWVEDFERQYVAWLMQLHRGNVSRAARAADMDRKHLHRLLKRHGHR
jgi:DNA-binding NtrC family response regulator